MILNIEIMNNIYRLLKRLSLLVLAFLLSFTAFAQRQITVTGVVTDENDIPLVGVGVFEKGTTNGRTTDIDGKYSITVSNTAVLVYSYISYTTQEIPVAGKTIMNVKLLPDNNLLDEVLVIGYGTMKRSDLTGAIASVSEKNLRNYKTASVMEALGGQVAGVNITSLDGTPGAGFDVKIRGVGTVNGSYAPLYIVDGFEVDNIDFLANQDIQSVEVLKDASASAIYGARAANGVVLVTTKSGREGKAQVTYNGSASYRVLAKRMELLSPYDFVKLQLEINPSRYGTTYFNIGEDEKGEAYKYQSIDDYKGVDGVDWQKEAFRPTWSQNHDVSVSGGAKGTSYTASFSHFDENGIFTNSGYWKNSARVKLRQKINDWIKFDGSINYTNTKRTGMGTSGGVLSNLLRYRPTGGLGVSDYDLRHSMYDPLSLTMSNFDSNRSNPILQVEATDQVRRDEQWVASGSVTIDIIKGLTFKTSGTYNANYRRSDIFYGKSSSQAYRAGGVYGQAESLTTKRWSNNNVLNYKKNFTRKHKTEFMLGHEVSFRGTESLFGQAKDFPFDNLGTDNLGLGATPSQVSTFKDENLRLSFFARAFYNFDDRFMLTATMRADASTVFSENHKWGYFPSFAAAWNISNEKFMKQVDWISNLKLRAGWGTVGNDRISNYLSMDLYTTAKYGVGTSQVTVLTPKQIANKNLKWEGSTTANLGVDLGLFKDRINLTVDLFNKDTKDLLLAQSLAHVTGFDSQWQNIGKIRNRGLELTLNTVNFSKRNFFWSTTFNMSFIKNTLVSLQGGVDDYILSKTGFNTNFNNYDYISYVGSALGDMYGYVYEGVYQYSDFNMMPGGGMVLKEGVPDISTHAGTSVEPGMVKYKDLDGDGIITTADRTKIGNGQPKWFGGITNTFNFYDFDFSFMFQFTYGNDIYNATRLFSTQSKEERYNMFSEVADRWRPDNASSRVPSAKGYVSSELYSRFIEDGSFLRLKNITLGYSLPHKLINKVHLSKLRAYVTMQNLFCLTKYSGYDPEVSMRNSPLMPGFDWGAYPKSRTYTFGVEIQF
jgi:hypothetical protein